MKTLIFCLSMLILFSSQIFAQKITTFNGNSANWGWSGKGYDELKVKSFLEENFRKTPKFDLQAMANERKLDVEFLWKIEGDIGVIQKLTSSTQSSWIWANAQPTSMTVVFNPVGKGYILLIQKDYGVVGRLTCVTSASRDTSKKYHQLVEGDYVIGEKKLVHESTELPGAVLNKAMYTGTRGIYFHKREQTPSHGCIGLPEPSQDQLYKLIPQQTPFKVVWTK